jgi:beta-phosphoglucomutase-like phosphatase (HAD superfamily)
MAKPKHSHDSEPTVHASAPPPLPKWTSPASAARAWRAACDELGAGEVAIVRNPSYVYAPFEIYPLPPRPTGPLPRLAGVVKDMDGTTTTTEPLCLHSLEWMVRQVTGRTDTGAWPGLDHERDYPQIIGNSTTKHVEYLLETYREDWRPDVALHAYIVAALWTLREGRDPGRRREVRANIPALGLGALLEAPEWRVLAEGGADSGKGQQAGTPTPAPQNAGETPTPQNAGETPTPQNAGETPAPQSMQATTAGPQGAAPWDEAAALALAERLAPALLPGFRQATLGDRTRAAVDIYYSRYHTILNDIADGQGERRRREVFGASSTARLIEPMPGVGWFLAAVKGWLGADLALAYEELAGHLTARREDLVPHDPVAGHARLAALGAYFERHPVPVAVVTSSIASEAEVVLGEVFGILRAQAAEWPIPKTKRDRILAAFAGPHACYDAVITASDSSEIRLKPHRDLYSIALHALGVAREDYPCVVGFEDSESGVLAIRAAGVGVAAAVPFADTAGHDLSAATHLLHGQLPEALLVHGCFLDPAVLGE